MRSLSREEVRRVDAEAIEALGLPGIVLMENAGRSAVDALMRTGVSGRVVICAGKGNNGGDGFVMARHLSNRGVDVRTLLFARPEALTGDAAIAWNVIDRAGSSRRVLGDAFDAAAVEEELCAAEWIVDALLGTGLRGPVTGGAARLIERINAAGKKTFAIDLPSGMDCDTGEPLGICVRADVTATFVARKRGFDAPSSRRWTGRVEVCDIGVPNDWLLRRFGASE